MAKKISLSIIIPVFNEEQRIPLRFEQAYKFLKDNFKNFEIIFVNDGSTDKSDKILKKIIKYHSNIKFVSYPQNKGKGYAIKRGIKEAEGRVIGFTDADFAVDLSGVKIALKSIRNGADIVIGDRNADKSKLINNPSYQRKFVGRLLSKLNQIFLPLGSISDSQNGFKFFKKNVAKELFEQLSINRWLFDIQLLALAGRKKYKIIQQPVTWEEVAQSKVTIFNDLPKVGFDLLNLYFQFMTTRFFILLLGLILLLILSPFLINPESLTKRNGDFSDLVWPNYFFIKESIFKYNQLPLWNPTLFSGIPEIANPQSPMIYPPNILALIVPVDHAIVILFFIHALMAGIFLYKLTREELRWSVLGSIAATFTLVFSPFFWTKIAVGHVSQIFAIFLISPILFFGYLFLKTQKWKYLFLTSLILAMQYLNYPTIWYFTNLFIALFLIGNFTLRFFKKNLLIFIAPVISLLIILPIFLLQLQAGPLITRSILNINDLAIPIWSLTRFIKSVFIPSNFLFDNETEVWLYPSLVALFLAGYGFMKLEKKMKLVVVIMLIIVFLITIGGRTPIFGLLTQYFPGFSYLRVSTRDWFVFIVLLAFLAGFCLEKIPKKMGKILLTLLITDLIFFATIRIWFVPEIMRYKKPNDFTQYLKLDSQNRVYCTSRCLSPRETLPQGIFTADGYHLLILRDYRIKLSEAGGFIPPEYTGNLPTYSVTNSQPSSVKLGKMAVKWVISKNQLTDSGFREQQRFDSYIIFENTKVKKRFYFENSTNQINIQKDSPNLILINTSGISDNFIVADSFYPGWEAFIDNKKTSIQKYDGWARSIFVPEGNHLVKLQFLPFNFSSPL